MDKFLKVVLLFFFCMLIAILLVACQPVTDHLQSISTLPQPSSATTSNTDTFTRVNPATSTADEASNPISVSESTEPRMIPSDFFGYTTGFETILGDYWHNQDFLDTVSRLQPGNLLYPGSIVANYWDWEKGWFTPWGESPFNQIVGVRPIPNRLEDFYQVIKTSGVTPIFNLNLLSASLESQIRMLRHAQELGMKVKYIELGSQFYSSQADYVKKFPTGKDYGLVASRWIVALRKEFPDAQIAVDGVIADDQSTTDVRLANWNKEIFQTLHGADALTLQVYTSFDDSTVKESKENLSSAVPLVLGTSFQVGGSLTQRKITDLPSGMRLWITEYNYYDQKIPIQGTWLHGLFLAAQSLLFLDDRRIDLITNSRLIGKADFGAIFSDEHGFQFDPVQELVATPPPTLPLTDTASGSALTYLGEAMRGSQNVRKLVFSPKAPELDQEGNNYPSLLGYSFNGSDGEKVILLNLSDTSYPVNLDSIFSQEITFKQLSGDPLTQISNPNLLLAVKGEKTSANLTLPPYSITNLEGK
jgi:hypothetical protein